MYPPRFSNHPTSPKKEFLEKQKKTPNLPTLKNKQTFFCHATQETTPWDSPHPPPKQFPFPNPPKIPPLKRNGITPSSPHPKKSF